ncbi:hypothetical protein [Enterococcus casseliflavus]|uniref:hypothetical protein n=1 Tax=Enterococcus casseliflavus TaxID=37734 RepID=UPI0018845FA9|nr:hypothetical protein [Enterococcus casseliflavus]MBE9906796.1 hypothetical protein [Enterococcus casseliflavus]
MKKEIVTSLMTTAILGTFTVETCFAQEKDPSYLTDPTTHHVLLKDGDYWYDEGKAVPKEYAEQLIANEQLSKPAQAPDPHPTLQVPSQRQPACEPQQIPALKKQNEQTVPLSKEPFAVPEMKPDKPEQQGSTEEPRRTPQAVPPAVPKPSRKVEQEVVPTSAPYAVPDEPAVSSIKKKDDSVPTKAPMAVPEKIPAPLVTFDSLVPNKVPYAVPGATPTAINQNQEFLVPTKIPMAVPSKIPTPLSQTEFPQPGIPVNAEPKALTIVHPNGKEQIAALPSSEAMKTKNLDNGIHRQQKSNTPSRVKSIRKKLVQQKPKEPSKKNFDNNEERENTRLNHKQQTISYAAVDNSYLPKTGENRLLSFLMQAVGIMVIGIAGLLFFRKKGRHEK